MEIISIHLVSILATILNVLLLYFILRRFLVKPVNQIMEQRQKELDEERAQAARTEEEAQALKKEYTDKMNEIERLSRQTLSDAELRGSKEYERIVAEAAAKADEIISDANAKVKMREKALNEQTATMLADLVAAATAKVAVSEENADLDSSLYDKFLEKAGEGE